MGSDLYIYQDNTRSDLIKIVDEIYPNKVNKVLIESPFDWDRISNNSMLYVDKLPKKHILLNHWIVIRSATDWVPNDSYLVYKDDIYIDSLSQ